MMFLWLMGSVGAVWGCARHLSTSSSRSHDEASRGDAHPCHGASQCAVEAESILAKGAAEERAHVKHMLQSCTECAEAPPAAFLLLGDLFGAEDPIPFRRAVFRRAVRRHPEVALLWQALARVAFAAKDSAEGLEALARAHQLRPDDSQIEAEYRLARRTYGTVTDQKEEALEGFFEDAQARLDAGDVQGALRCLETALVHVSDVPRLVATVRLRLALIHLSVGAPRRALESIETALRDYRGTTPLRARFLTAYAEILLALDRADEALVAASAAVEIMPDDPLGHANLALARGRIGDVEGGLRAWENAFARGLALRMDKRAFLELGPALEPFRNREEFSRLINRAYGP